MARRKNLMEAIRGAITRDRALATLYHRELMPGELADRVAKLRANRELRRSRRRKPRAPGGREA